VARLKVGQIRSWQAGEIGGPPAEVVGKTGRELPRSKSAGRSSVLRGVWCY
jgi:hypothetical protein